MKNKLGVNIKNRRELLGLTTRELADKCGYKSHTSIVKVENGLSDITIEKLYVIAEALKTTPIELTGWLDEDESEDE